jgi:hypothetical protein
MLIACAITLFCSELTSLNSPPIAMSYFEGLKDTLNLLFNTDKAAYFILSPI